MPLGIARLTSLSNPSIADGTFAGLNGGGGSSRTPASITLYNDSHISTSQYKIGSSSLFLNQPDARVLTNVTLPATGDFTVEFWMNSPLTGANALGAQYQVGNSNYLIIYNSSGYPRMSVGGTVVTSSNRVFQTVNTWHHVAVTRTGDTFKMYVNGTLEVTVTKTISLLDVPFVIGGYINGTITTGGDYAGYLDEIRISDTVRYTSNFTPDTAGFSDDANTLLLLHCEGANLSTEVKDDVNDSAQLYRYDPYADYLELAVTFDDVPGGTGTTDIAHLINTNLTGAKTKTEGTSVSIQATDYKWGSDDANSIDYEGAEQNSRTGSALTYDLSSNGGTSMPASGSGTFVVEGWFKATSSGTNQNWCLSSADSGGRWLFGINNGSSQTWANENNVGIGTGWHHFAIVCDSGTKRAYIDGIYEGAWYSTNSGFSTIHLGQFNGGDSNDFLGYIQDFKVYIGTNKGITGTSTTAKNFLLPESISERWT